MSSGVGTKRKRVDPVSPSGDDDDAAVERWMSEVDREWNAYHPPQDKPIPDHWETPGLPAPAPFPIGQDLALLLAPQATPPWTVTALPTVLVRLCEHYLGTWAGCHQTLRDALQRHVGVARALGDPYAEPDLILCVAAVYDRVVDTYPTVSRCELVPVLDEVLPLAGDCDATVSPPASWSCRIATPVRTRPRPDVLIQYRLAAYAGRKAWRVIKAHHRVALPLGAAARAAASLTVLDNTFPGVYTPRADEIAEMWAVLQHDVCAFTDLRLETIRYYPY
jgi:hypothetical protein